VRTPEELTPEEKLRAAGATFHTFEPDNDARRDHGAANDDRPPPRGKTFGRLRVLTVADALAAPARSYLLRGLIAPAEMSLWWGAPKCGKSFLLLRLAYGLALGAGMWERVAKPCSVLYVAAEGEGGFAARLIALRDTLGDAGDGFRYIAQRTMVGPPADDLEDVIAAALDMGAGVIVLDTLARTFGEGDENSARDMGGFVASVDRLRAETGAHVAVIHHGTKEGGSSRGSGALLGAADLIVKVTKDVGGGPNLATVEAAKDEADGAALAFRLRVVELAPGPDGTTRTTCVAEEAAGSGRRAKPLPRVARDALRYLADLILTEGVPLPAGPLFPLGIKGVPEARWREECETRRLSMAEAQKDRAHVFRGAAQQLREAGMVAMRDGLVWQAREAPADA
jgi:hypothetical protein